MKTINELVEFLKKCDDAYYNSDSTLVSNDTYDALVESLKKMDPANEYLNKVGSEVRKGSSKVGRLIPMGTLSKYHTEDEVKEWLLSENSEVLLSPKYDGFGVEIIYIDGKLSMASTRGDGYTGEDVTEAIKLINYVPLQLPDDCKNITLVRGEAIIPKSNHDKMKSMGYTAMRNAVPGIVRSCNKDALPYVDFVAYEFFDGTNDRDLQRVCYKGLFNVENYTKWSSDDFDKILETRNAFGKIKESYVYEIDGMVLKTNHIMEDELSCPKHQIAWKFLSKRKETILREIRKDVGAAGNISVVGVFDPVEFQGANLTSASFGSVQRYNELKPYIGCTVEVSRRGDIIPMIEDVLDPDDSKFVLINECPCCGTSLVNYRCPNKYCSDKVKKKVLQYIQCFGVKGIGSSLVSKLVDSGIIRDLTDIYKMDAEIIRTIPRQGDSAVNKWKDLQVKEVTVLNVLCFYPFENLGEAVWKPILDKLTVNELLETTVDNLRSLEIKGLGESKLNSICTQINEFKEELQELLNLVNVR